MVNVLKNPGGAPEPAKSIECQAVVRLISAKMARFLTGKNFAPMSP